MDNTSKVNSYYLKEVANLQQVNVKPFYLSWPTEADRFIKGNLFKMMP
jgi:hypothetical protein